MIAEMKQTGELFHALGIPGIATLVGRIEACCMLMPAHGAEGSSLEPDTVFAVMSASRKFDAPVEAGPVTPAGRFERNRGAR